MSVSQFRRYAIGTAAENKPLSTHELKVTPHEVLPFLDGELREAPTPLAFSGTESDGTAYDEQLTSDNVLVATWLPEASNRVTAPDVRRGERIIIYTYGDSDQYYWRPMGLDDHLRRLETVIFAISATQDESTSKLNLENCYFIEISSHGQHVTLGTSKANGEPFAYTLQINAGEGEVHLEDDIGTQVLMDSTNNNLSFKNALGTSFELNKHIINAKAQEKFEVTVGSTKLTLTPGGTVLSTPKFEGKQS